MAADGPVHDRVEIVLQQQRAIAAFGHEALYATDLDKLLHRAAVLAGEGLFTRNAKVLEWRREYRDVLIRAGCGWKDGVVGSTLAADHASPAGYALATGKPVISEDLAQEKRYRIPQLLIDHGIQSAANVIIDTHEGAFGVLEVDDTKPRKFTQDDSNFLLGFANLVGGAVYRFRAMQALKQSAEHNALLLRELHHRVSNNLAQLSALMRIQKGNAASDGERHVLDAFESRLSAMRLLYRTLTYDRSHMTVNAASYLTELVRALHRLHGAKDIEFDIDVPDTKLRLDTAIPLGLVVNEFVTNSLKYAFPERHGTVSVRLAYTPEDQCEITLVDNGVGLPAEPSRRQGLGLSIISRLADQLGATAKWSRDQGTRLALVFSECEAPEEPESR